MRKEDAMIGTIVVGVDGSHPARLAARWAAREAELRDADLVLISAWNVPVESFAFAGPAFTDDALKSLEMTAEQHLGDALDEVRLASNGVDVTTKAIEGQAASVLLHAARTADLLVVGSRGLGGFRGLLLGSVSQQCVDHAACPVVVVRHLHAEV
jgi:nucleotide-binding universal stress UspA family protein